MNKKEIKEKLNCTIIIILLSGILFISFNYIKNCSSTKLIFTDPEIKLRELSSSNYTFQLFKEAVKFEPLLNKSGTQVHMGFWSSRGNHGSLVRLLDDINYYSSKEEDINKAVWDEGVLSSLQYPSYVEINSQEFWYERINNNNSTVVIYGINYTDPYNISLKIADEIWGRYSERYTELAGYFKNATGRTVQVWCFVENASKNRIFYTYEFPVLEKLEKEGVVEVHFAKTQDANWKESEDWIVGTANILI